MEASFKGRGIVQGLVKNLLIRTGERHPNNEYCNVK